MCSALWRRPRAQANPPSLDAGSVVSVLISADFLQMSALTGVCIQYLRGAIHEVLRLPIELSCLTDGLLTQLAALFEPDDIDRLRDKKVWNTHSNSQ